MKETAELSNKILAGAELSQAEREQAATLLKFYESANAGVAMVRGSHCMMSLKAYPQGESKLPSHGVIIVDHPSKEAWNAISAALEEEFDD